MKKVGRNDPCPCGSGKKHKFCCLHKDNAPAANSHAGEVSIPRALRIAIEHHRGGRLPQAEASYRRILRVAPNHADAVHLLGDIFRQRGNIEIAVEFINKAINAKPAEPIYYNSLGNALQAQARLDEALASYRQALSIKPDFAAAYSNLLFCLIHDESPICPMPWR